jgi:hypothetical protein
VYSNQLSLLFLIQKAMKKKMDEPDYDEEEE